MGEEGRQRRRVEQLWSARAQQQPDAVAVVLAGEEGDIGALSVSYAALADHAECIARSLQGRVTPGEPIVVAGARHPDLVAAYLGTLAVGGVYVPLDLDYPEARLRAQLAGLGGRPLALVDDEARSALAKLPVELSSIPRPSRPDAVSGSDSRFRSRSVERGDLAPAYVMFTSGSTGQPKGVTVSHRNIASLVQDVSFARIDESTRFLSLAPLAFDASTLEIWGPLLNGGTVIQYPSRGTPDPERLRMVIATHRVNSAWLTASLFNFIVDYDLEILRPLEQLLIGGEALSVPHVGRALAALEDLHLVNGYGPTEATTFTTCHPIRPTFDPSAPHGVPIGTPIQGRTIRVCDATGRALSTGEPGELWSGGEGVALGYWKSPEATRARFVEDGAGARWYRTGDRVVMDAGGVVHFLGREDDQVKLRGHRIELGEVEHKLRGLRGVREAAALIDPVLSVPVAFVVAVEQTDPAGLRAALAGELPPAAVPSRVELLDALPLTPSGKVDRGALRARLTREPQPRDGSSVSLESVEARVRAVWGELLRTEVASNDHFFESGGTSLLALQFIRVWREQTGRPVPVAWLFERPTPASL
ncbi:MAG: non-ribosomal peptide synthetase, partial [Myxococcota bacterium]